MDAFAIGDEPEAMGPDNDAGKQKAENDRQPDALKSNGDYGGST
jgi:hypothetical protein